jgi:hypothetical protein
MKCSKKYGNPQDKLEIKIIFEYTVPEKVLTFNYVLRNPEKRRDYGRLKVFFLMIDLVDF